MKVRHSFGTPIGTRLVQNTRMANGPWSTVVAPLPQGWHNGIQTHGWRAQTWHTLKHLTWCHGRPFTQCKVEEVWL